MSPKKFTTPRSRDGRVPIRKIEKKEKGKEQKQRKNDSTPMKFLTNSGKHYFMSLKIFKTTNEFFKPREQN